jgi:GNAT superfamily N-acetyltransferase
MKSLFFFATFIFIIYAVKINSSEEIECIFLSAREGRALTELKFEALPIHGLSACLKSCFTLENYSDYSTLKYVLDCENFDNFFFIQKTTRKVIGTVSLWPLETLQKKERVIVIYNVCLSPGLRGKGNGTFLIQEALKRHYSSFGVELPSLQNPVLLVLTVVLSSPTFIEACNLYRKLGFYNWECGNFMQRKEWTWRLEGKVEELRNMNCQSMILNEWNRKCTLAEGDRHVTMYRLDIGPEGLLRFVLPPGNFCQRLRKKIQSRKEGKGGKKLNLIEFQ